MTDWDGFFRLHDDLPREGPGDIETLNWALDRAEIGVAANILDAGCGPGGDVTGLLAHAPEGLVTAVDAHAPFIRSVEARFAGDPRVLAVVGDMTTPPNAPFDLIWCAGALYFLGLVEGLRRMHGLLDPGGALAISYPCYFVSEPGSEAKAFWAAEDLIVPTEADIRDHFVRAGFQWLGACPLPDAAWHAYYAPLLARAEMLESEADPALADAILDARTEAEAWMAAKDETGYLLVVGRRP